MTLEAKLNDAASADGIVCSPSFYATDKMLIPVLSTASGNYLIVYSLLRNDLTSVFAFKITFTSAYTISTASVTSDDDGNIYITCS